MDELGYCDPLVQTLSLKSLSDQCKFEGVSWLASERVAGIINNCIVLDETNLTKFLDCFEGLFWFILKHTKHLFKQDLLVYS